MRPTRAGALFAVAVSTSPLCAISQTMTLYSVPTKLSDPGGIVQGPDGNIWFTEQTFTEFEEAALAG